MHRLAVFILLTFIVGCATASQMSYKGRAYYGLTKEDLVLNDVSSLKGAGIVMGRVVRENVTGGFADYIDRSVIFRSLDTGRVFNYYDGDYFFIRLPEGQYEIIGFETRHGIPLRATNAGFRFKVRDGKIIYIGNITGEKGLKRFGKNKSQGLSPKVFVSGYYRGGASLFIPQTGYNYNFYVIDDKQKLLEQFEFIFPNLTGIEVATYLMN